MPMRNDGQDLVLHDLLLGKLAYDAALRVWYRKTEDGYTFSPGTRESLLTPIFWVKVPSSQVERASSRLS